MPGQSDVVAHSELNSAPDSATAHGLSVGAQDVMLASEELILPADVCDEQPPCAADQTDEHPDQLAFFSPQPRIRNSTRRIGRALLKPLVMLATSQYFIVAMLAGLTAVTLASAIAKTVSSSLEPLLAALKRL